MAGLGFSTNVRQSRNQTVDPNAPYDPWASWVPTKQPTPPGKTPASQATNDVVRQAGQPYGNDVYRPAGQPYGNDVFTGTIPPTSYGDQYDYYGRPVANAPAGSYATTPNRQGPGSYASPPTGGAPGYNYAAVDRTKLAAYPTGWDPNTQPGQKYISGQGWTPVQSGADVTWDAGTNTYYYHGVPITDAEYQMIAKNGPGALMGDQAQASYMNSGDVYSNLSNLGFGSRYQPVQAPQLQGVASPQAGQVSAPPAIMAPHVQAEQGGFQDFDALQRSIYRSQFDPVARELERQRGLADDQLAAKLAQAGIAESGTGVAQRAKQYDDYTRQVIAASQDAANQAAVQRYGMEYNQSMENAKMRQEANLANAGFDLTAQAETAKNFLTANVANAQMATQASIAGAQIQSQQQIAQGQLYLQSMGLNFQMQDAAQKNYLQLLNLQEQDMARMDDYQLNSLALFYNTYLKEVAIMVQAGQVSYGKNDSSTNQTRIDLGF